MKKVISILTAIILITGYALAQKEYATAGVVEFGGSFSYTSVKTTTKYEGTKVGEGTLTAISLAPEVGYFVTDNIQLGAALAYTSTEYKPEGGESSKWASTTLFLSPGYIFKVQAENVYPYARLLIGMVSSGNGTKTSLTDYGINAGVKIKIVEGGLLNIGISYIMGTGKSENSRKLDLEQNMLVLSIGFTLYK